MNAANLYKPMLIGSSFLFSRALNLAARASDAVGRRVAPPRALPALESDAEGLS